MIIREPFDLWFQNDELLFVPIGVCNETGTGFPNTVRIPVDCCEDIEQVLNIYVPRCDPSCSPKSGPFRLKMTDIRMK